MTLVELFKQLKSEPSIKAKEQIIEANQDNEYFLELLYRNLNPDLLFQFTKMPEEKSLFHGAIVPFTSEREAYNEFINLLDKLQNRDITGNEAGEQIIHFFYRLMNIDLYNLFKSILFKEPIGVTAKTVNKVLPWFIPEFKLMLAPSEIANVTKLNYPTYCQRKLDGYRCIYKNGNLFSRTGKPLANKQLLEYFECLQGIKDYVLDGELYFHREGFNKIQTILTTEDLAIPKGLKYHVYDCIPIDDWNKQETKLTYEKRLKLLRRTVNDSIADYSKVIDVPADLVESAGQLVELYKGYLKDGYEGVMLKSPEGTYQWKRVTAKSQIMLKLKPFDSLDLRIIGYEEGTGKLKGTLGAIIVTTDAGVSINCGTGLSESTRNEIWNNQSKYLGKIAQIKYQEITEDGSLRFPVFECIREDKE